MLQDDLHMSMGCSVILFKVSPDKTNVHAKMEETCEERQVCLQINVGLGYPLKIVILDPMEVIGGKMIHEKMELLEGGVDSDKVCHGTGGEGSGVKKAEHNFIEGCLGQCPLGHKRRTHLQRRQVEGWKLGLF